MNDCVFCKIINNTIPSKTIYEDDCVKVFMDANPDTNGHVLIVPKRHIVDFTELDDETVKHINKIVKDLKPRFDEALHPDGYRLVNNYGCYQLVKHYHLHMIPCYEPKQGLIDSDVIFAKLTK